MCKINIKTLSRILSFCQSDEDISNLVSVLDMIWSRDTECSVLEFKAEDITFIAQTINKQRLNRGYKPVLEVRDEVDLIPISRVEEN